MPDRKSVLVIEDDRGVAEILLDLLESSGFEVSLCHNGAAALKFIQWKCFDVFITDYRMDGMNGADLARSLRTPCPDSLIIGMSAEQRDEDFLAAGADIFLKKPFCFSELVSIMSKNSSL